MISRQTSQDGHSSLKPVLFVDVDGVLSVFGFPHDGPPPGRMHSVDGMPHCLVHGCGERLLRLTRSYELVWATGWEERANEHLPHLLGLGREFPTLEFDHQPQWGAAHWKLSAIERYAGNRPAAWIDDNFNEACRFWAGAREAATLLVHSDPAVGITDRHVEELETWAAAHAAR
jgi:HAD domain in Swiss Army Knife RNA repair proteins